MASVNDPIYRTYPTDFTYEGIYNYVPSTCELLSKVMQEFFGVKVTMRRLKRGDCRLRFYLESGEVFIVTTSCGSNIGCTLVYEYFDNEHNETLPKANYRKCPIDGTPHRDHPDARLIEVVSMKMGRLKGWVPYGNGGWTYAPKNSSTV